MSNNKTYYEILELNHDCTNEDIAGAYRRLALKFHPKRNSNKDFAVNNYQFHLISEAFTVLNSSILRGVYDVYGKDGLKNGVLDESGNLKGGYKYSGNALELFEKFFATHNPFALVKDGQLITDEYGSMFGNGFGGLLEPQAEPVPDLEIDFLIDLEEVYSGGVKTLTYSRTVLNEDKRTTYETDKEINIEISPGIKENTKITFPKLGNELPGKEPSNLIVTIKSKANNKFKRKEADLFFTYKLNLVEALNSIPLVIETLDNRKLYITMDEIISPQSVKKIEGEGLPNIDHKSGFKGLYSKTNSKKGDLFVNFDIKFPRYLNQEVKDELVNLLEDDRVVN